MLLNAEIKKMLLSNGVYDVGYCHVPDAPCGLDYAVSIVAALSDAIVDEIDSGAYIGTPTHTYFHHYRTVNAFIDNMLLRTGLMLQREGYQYIPIAASQSINSGGTRAHFGRYSHKKAAVLAGLGTVGKSTLFLHNTLGPRVRLGTLFTDCPLVETSNDLSHSVNISVQSLCGDCRLCVDACPAQAIKGAEWQPGLERGAQLDPDACNSYMRTHFMAIGRGAVCGICMKVCPGRSNRVGNTL